MFRKIKWTEYNSHYDPQWVMIRLEETHKKAEEYWFGQILIIQNSWQSGGEFKRKLNKH